MTILICPGIHAPDLTEKWLRGIQLGGDWNQQQWLLYPAPQWPAYSPPQILQFLQTHCGENPDPITFISFSAGVVGAIGAARSWQTAGHIVHKFIACDGWGVPLVGDFPIYRLSHDYFTHWSSALLGAGADNFYADPPVDHQQLWSYPHTTAGWWTHRGAGGQTSATRTTTAHFLQQVLSDQI